MTEELNNLENVNKGLVEQGEELLDEKELKEQELAELLAQKHEEKVKHSVSRKRDVRAKLRKASALDEDDLEVYQDNPDKYLNKKSKKTLKIRQNKKQRTNKKERREAKEIENYVKKGQL